jgi:hypothetical protein
VITLNMLSEIYIYTIPIKVRGVRSPFKKLGRFGSLYLLRSRLVVLWKKRDIRHLSRIKVYLGKNLIFNPTLAPVNNQGLITPQMPKWRLYI